MPQSLFDAYVADAARAFYPHHFAVGDERRRAVQAAARPLAPAVARALSSQNARLPVSAARDANLRALTSGASAVVTGQQAGLFLGPLYTVYKAATAVMAARALARETQSTVVPVFWLQTEDHDLPEIASVHVPRAAGEALTLSVALPADNRASVAHVTWPAEIEACVGALEHELGHLPEASAHLANIRRHYARGASLAGSFACVLAELFADDGLVFVDPRDPALAACVAHVHRRALCEHDALGRALLEQTSALERAGFAAAVHVRPDATLSFFHALEHAGPRERLRAVSGGFAGSADEITYSLAELLARLERDPMAFSTSALLRPIVQDTLLPTAAYVGGPAEVAYFAQLAPLYAAFGMTMPLVVPRARFRIVDDKAQRLLARLGLSGDDLARDEDTLLAELCSRDAVSTTPSGFAHTLGARFEAALSETLAPLGTLAPEVAASAEKTRATLRNSAEKLAQKYQRALAHRDSARVADVQRLANLLQPHGKPQERYYGMSYYAARLGERAFISLVLANIVPFDAAPRELRL